MRLGARFEVRDCARQDLLELTRGVRTETRRDVDAGEMDPSCCTAARRGAFEVRAGSRLVGLLQRDDPEKLLRAGELVAVRRDAAKVCGGLTRRLLRDVELGEHKNIGVAQRTQCVRVLERDDRQARFAETAKELRAHVVRAP